MASESIQKKFDSKLTLLNTQWMVRCKVGAFTSNAFLFYENFVRVNPVLNVHWMNAICELSITYYPYSLKRKCITLIHRKIKRLLSKIHLLNVFDPPLFSKKKLVRTWANFLKISMIFLRKSSYILHSIFIASRTTDLYVYSFVNWFIFYSESLLMLNKKNQFFQLKVRNDIKT